nr:reverse transcriptase domain-containing protein [Tanacetum cinerariifolium]
MTENKIDVIELACEEYSQEVLGFSNVTTSGTPTPQNDPIISVTSLTLTPFGDSDFLLFEEADAFLGLEDDPDSPKINPFYYELEGDILLLEAILNSEPPPPLPNQEQNLPLFKEELKAYKAQTNNKYENNRQKSDQMMIRKESYAMLPLNEDVKESKWILNAAKIKCGVENRSARGANGEASIGDALFDDMSMTVVLASFLGG